MSQARQQGFVAALLLPHLPTVYEAQAWFLPNGVALLCCVGQRRASQLTGWHLSCTIQLS